MFLYVTKIPGNQQFHCLPTVQDFADILGDWLMSLSDSSAHRFSLWLGGTVAKHLSDW